jgi:hypothetical protein
LAATGAAGAISFKVIRILGRVGHSLPQAMRHAER